MIGSMVRLVYDEIQALEKELDRDFEMVVHRCEAENENVFERALAFVRSEAAERIVLIQLKRQLLRILEEYTDSKYFEQVVSGQLPHVILRSSLFHAIKGKGESPNDWIPSA